MAKKTHTDAGTTKGSRPRSGQGGSQRRQHEPAQPTSSADVEAPTGANEGLEAHAPWHGPSGLDGPQARHDDLLKHLTPEQMENLFRGLMELEPAK